jgi:hypothetical protein
MHRHPNPDKPEPKGRSQKASHAKPQRTQRKSSSLGFKPNDLAFLCELGAFARKFSFRFGWNLVPSAANYVQVTSFMIACFNISTDG